MSKTVNQGQATNEKDTSSLQLRCGFAIPLGRTTDFSLISNSIEDHHLRDLYMRSITGEGSVFYQRELQLELTARQHSVATIRWSHFTHKVVDAAADTSWTGDRLTVLWAALFDLVNTSDWTTRYWDSFGVYHFRIVSEEADHALVFEAFTNQIVDILAKPCLYDGEMDLRAAWNAASNEEKREFLVSINAVEFDRLADLPPARWAAIGSASVNKVIETAKAARPIAAATAFGLNCKDSQSNIDAANEMIADAQNRKLSTDEKKSLASFIQAAQKEGAVLWFLHNEEYKQCRIAINKRSDANTVSFVIREADGKQRLLMRRANLLAEKGSLVLNRGKTPKPLTPSSRTRYNQATRHPT